MTPFPGAEVSLVRTLWSIMQAWQARDPVFEDKSLTEHLREVFTNPKDWHAFDTGLCGYRRLTSTERWSQRQQWLHRLGLQFHEQWRQWYRQKAREQKVGNMKTKKTKTKFPKQGKTRAVLMQRKDGKFVGRTN